MQNDVLFIQFMSRSRRGYWDLVNGFSDTFDLCRSRGDFHWVEHEPDSARWYSEETYQGKALPISRGTVYISASYINHLYQACVWARQYPEIRFVAGGPVAAQRSAPGEPWEPLYFKIREGARLPENLEITGRSVEDFFGVPDFSGAWKLDIPEDRVSSRDPVYLSYTLDNGCYWGKCIYCNIKEAPKDFFRKREHFDYGFSRLDHPGKKIVRLNTGSITPAYIRDVFSTLPNRPDLEYRTFMRCSRAENRALREVLEKRGSDFPQITLGIGIEFPSDRMLGWMNKGITAADILETLEICAEYGLHANGNIIFGWENLTEDDIREARRFFENMPENAMTTAQLRWLYAHPHLEIHEQYRGEPIDLGPFYLGFRADISEEGIAVNREAVAVVESASREKGFSIEGLNNMKG